MSILLGLIGYGAVIYSFAVLPALITRWINKLVWDRFVKRVQKAANDDMPQARIVHDALARRAEADRQSVPGRPQLYHPAGGCVHCGATITHAQLYCSGICTRCLHGIPPAVASKHK